ncbi:MAG: hypothetical protein JW760_09590 [Spirochaetales bacterium]|nr:hypothetical protein [Spirochaetales bacterium]
MKNLFPILIILGLFYSSCETTLPEVPTSPPVEAESIPAEETPPPSEPVQTEETAAAVQEKVPEAPFEPVSGGLFLTVTAYPGGPEVPVLFKIYHPDEPHTSLIEETGTTAAFTLPPGNYTLTAAWETGTRRIEGLSVAAGRLTERRISLDTGTLTLEFLSSPGGEPAETAFSLHRAGSGEEPLIESVSARGDFLMAEGFYDLRVSRNGEDAWTRDIRVSAGETTLCAPVLSHGTLEVAFLNPEGAEPAWAEYRLYPAKDWEHILLWDGGEGFTRYLEEGQYDLYYAWDSGEGWVRNIRLVPGGVSQQRLILGK